MAVITLNPGEVLTVVFAETDGMFHIHFDTEKYPNAVAVEEAAGLPGNVCGAGDSVIYHDRMMYADAEDKEALQDEQQPEAQADEHPYPGHAQNVQLIAFDSTIRTGAARRAFAYPMQDVKVARDFVNMLLLPEYAAEHTQVPNNDVDPKMVTRFVVNATFTQVRQYLTEKLGDPVWHDLQGCDWRLAPHCYVALTQHGFRGPHGDAFLSIALCITMGERESKPSQPEPVICSTRAWYTAADHEKVLGEISLSQLQLGIDRNKLASDAFAYPLDVSAVKHFVSLITESAVAAPLTFSMSPTSLTLLLDTETRSYASTIASVRAALGGGTRIPYGHSWEVAKGCTVTVGPGPGEFSTDRVICLRIPEIDADDNFDDDDRDS